jgi:hypothetical protein
MQFPCHDANGPLRAGYYNLTLDWPGLRLPRHKEVINELVSDEIIKGGFYQVEKAHGQFFPEIKEELIPRFRVDLAHQLNAQVKDDSFIQFNKPSLFQIFSLLFASTGYLRLEPSSAARYQTNFVACAGGLQAAARLLSLREHIDICLRC